MNLFEVRFAVLSPAVAFVNDETTDAAKDEKDKMELESTMEYLQSHLKINLENAELFVAIYLVQAPSIGEITLRGFVDGWKLTGYVANTSLLSITC